MPAATEPPRPGCGPRLVRGALVSALVLGLLGASLEVALRAGWIPNARHKVRSVAVTVPDPKGEVLVLGDSFLVPQGMTGRELARGFAEHGIATRNTATSGTGPFEYLANLERVSAEDHPEVVLLGFYAGNDLTDVQNHPRYEGGSGSGVAIRRESPIPLLPRLYLYTYLRARLSLLSTRFTDTERLEAAGIAPDMIEAAQAFELNPFLLQLAMNDPGHFLDNLLVEREESVRAWGKVVELLDGVHRTCEERGVRLLVVVFPHTLQVNRDHFDFFRKLTFTLDERTLTTRRPQERMEAFCAERGIPMLDLLPELRGQADRSFFLELDDHFNAEGHRLAVERILDFAGEHGWGGAW